MHLIRYFLLLMTLFPVAGCHRSAVHAPLEKADAQAALEKMLSAWKSGESVDQFLASKSDVRVMDFDWREGVKLQDYSLESAPTVYGDSCNFQVKLTLVDPKGKRKSGRFVYIVASGPPVSILRE